MRFGLRVPSYAWPDLSYDDMTSFLDYCRRVEDGPYEDIWVIDHLLASRGVYGVSWLDPLIVLAAAAGVTTRVGLGTAALVLPLRHPVILAKEIASLHMVSGGRFRFGVAVGWDPDEFAAVDVPIRQRGKRTDESLRLIRRLLTESEVTYTGQFWEVENLTIYPQVPDHPPVWVAGGTLTHAPDTPDKPYMAPAVLDRILHADGWLARSSGSDPGEVKNDIGVVRQHLEENGREPADLIFGATQFVHIVETADQRAALEEQMPHFWDVMGKHRTDEDLRASYLTGNIDDIQGTVAELANAGLHYLVVTPLTNDAAQLDLITRHIVEPLTSRN